MTEFESVTVSSDMVEEAVGYLDVFESLSFRKDVEHANLQAFSLIREQYFSTWTTSPMGAELEKLERFSRNADLRSLIRTITIQDDCEQNDPYNNVSPFRSEVIWPGDEHGNILSEQIGIKALRAMLTDGRLRPDTIKIRDYCIGRSNFLYCPKNHNRQAYRNIGYGQDVTAVALLARDIIDGLGLSVTAVKMQRSSGVLSKHSFFTNPDAPPGMSLGSPLVAEATISLSSDRQQCDIALFSMLRLAEILAAPYWIEKMLYHAPLLEKLTISPHASWDDVLSSQPVPLQLKQLDICNSTIHASTIHAVLSGSLHTLRSMSFKFITLKQGSDWRDLLSEFRNFKHLTSFSLTFPRQDGPQNLPIDFIGFSEADLPEQCRPGLDYRERGPADDRRLTSIKYQGPDAGKVLARLALHAKQRLPYTAEYLDRHSLLTAQRNADV